MTRKPPAPGSRPPLSEEDRAVWDAFSQNIAPLQAKERVVDAPPPATTQRLSRPLPIPAAFEMAFAPPLEVGNTSAMHGKLAEKLRKGALQVDATLDLHGRTQEQSYGQFLALVERTAHRGGRVLHVITGRGRGESPGLLRDALPGWANTPALRPYILAITPAPQHMGGSGAFLVLLKRQREPR